MQTTRPRQASRERGTFLLPVVFLTFVLGVLSMNFLSEGLAQRADVTHAEARLRALELAEMGLSRAEMELRANTDPDGDGVGTVSGSFAGGTYRVTADLANPAQNRYVFLSTGSFQIATRRIEAGIRKPTVGLFQHAMFGKTSVKATGGSHTDGYDSDLGTWLAQATHTDADGYPYAEAIGHVGSNGLIVLSGPVRGDAIPGPFDIVDHGEAAWGDTTPRSEPAVIPDLTYEDFEAAFLDNDNLTIDVSDPKVSYDAEDMWLLSGGGAPITLSGGTYLFNTLKMTGGGNLIVTGPSKIGASGF